MFLFCPTRNSLLCVSPPYARAPVTISLNAQQYAFNQSTLGARMDVLVERAGGRPGQVAGRSPYMQAVNMAGDVSLVGRIVSCEVAEAKQNSIVGSVL